MMVQKKRKTRQNKKIKQNKKAEHKNRRWLALLLIGALVLPVVGQAVVVQEARGEKSSQIQKGGLRKAVNKGLNLEKDNESIPGEDTYQEQPSEQEVLPEQEGASEQEKPPEQEQPLAETAPSGEQPAETTETLETPETASPEGETPQGKKQEASVGEEKVRSRRSASPRREQLIYQRQWRPQGGEILSVGMDLYWNSANKELRGYSVLEGVDLFGLQKNWVAVGLSKETDRNLPGSQEYPHYTQSFTSIYDDGGIVGKNYTNPWDRRRGQSYTYQAYTGSLLSVARTQGNYYQDGVKRYDERMDIEYTQPGAPQNTEYFKVLADGALRRETGPHFLVSSTTLAYLDTTIKVHDNHMVVLGDDFLAKNGDVNKKIQMRVEDASGTGRFNATTEAGESYYNSFKDIQALQFENGDKLRIIDYSSNKETEYTYNSSRKDFWISKNNVPSNSYLIQFSGNGSVEKKGYEIFFEGGTIRNVWTKGSGAIHPNWGGKVYLSMGIFKSNGDLKKKGTMLGGNHTISTASEVSLLRGELLKDGDEIALYAAKDVSWDESSKIRILGNVENGMAELDKFQVKPDFNTKVFRYNASTRKLSQEDGTIVGMDEALKRTVEEKLRELSLNPESSNADKKAWQLGLYADASINFGGKNIKKLTGLEYAVNMTNISLANNPVKPETYRSLRNLIQLINLNIGGIGLQGNEKAMVDILVNLSGLKVLYAGYNGITDVKEFGRLRITDLNLDNNSISNLSSLYPMCKAGLESLNVSNQSVTAPKAEIEMTETYYFSNPFIGVEGGPEGYPYSSIRPAGKGAFSPLRNQYYWSDLEKDTKELGWDFVRKGIIVGARTNFSFGGRLTMPVRVFDSTKYRLRIIAGIGGEVEYKIGSDTGTITSNSQVGISREFNVLEGQSVTVRAVGKPGFRFRSWRDGSEEATRTFTMPAKEMSLGAEFGETQTVYFDPNGGQWVNELPADSTKIKVLDIAKGTTLQSVMEEFEFARRHPSGYRFTGWYETADGSGDEWDMDAPVNGDMTLYANWEYNNEAAFLLEIPKKVDLKSAGTGEATGTGAVKVVDSIEANLLYKNILIKATPNIRLTNPKTEEAYDVTVWKEDGSAYTDGSQPLMKLHPKGSGLPKEEEFTLKTPNLDSKKKGKYKGNMIFNISWE